MARYLHRCLGAAALAGLAGALLPSAPPVSAGEAPGLSARPEPRPHGRPDPLADWRAERRDEAAAQRAFEAARREDMQDWLWGGSWREWLDARRAAEGARIEAGRADALERRRAGPDGDVRELGERLDEQWRQQRDRWDDSRDSRFPGPRSPAASPIRR